MDFSTLVVLSESSDHLYQEIRYICRNTIPLIQDLYDSWSQDEDGVDEEFGAGGICDSISNILNEAFVEAGYDTTEGGQDGDDHSYIMVGKDRRIFMIDIPPHVYETGGGYSWRKKPDVIFDIDDFLIFEETELEYDQLFNVNI